MKEIKTFEDLWKIQEEKALHSYRNDLLLIRYCYRIIDGYVLMIGADCKEELELFFMSYNTFDNFTKGEKAYLVDYYELKK